MKKGFTMIELIFVIVILGILAAVAIPRLAATRDDAEVAKAATNATTIISDLGAFYTSQGKFATSGVQEMTNVQIIGTGAIGQPFELASAGKKCIKMTLENAVAEDGTKGKPVPAYLKVEKGTDATEKICEKVLANKGIKNLLNSVFTYQTIKTAANGTNAAVWGEETMGDGTGDDEGYVAISGLEVVF